MTTLTVLDTDETVDAGAGVAVDLAGARLVRLPDGRLLAPAFRGYAVDLGHIETPGIDDDEAVSALVVDYVETIQAHDWTSLRGVPLEDERD